MKLLLDTHIWLWILGEPARLKRDILREIENKASELWLSPLSVWEVLLLGDKGIISLAPSGQEWVALALNKVPVKEASLTLEVALATSQIRLPHHDPVDQFLAATARVFDLTLATADARLLEGKGFSLLANR